MKNIHGKPKYPCPALPGPPFPYCIYFRRFDAVVDCGHRDLLNMLQTSNRNVKYERYSFSLPYIIHSGFDHSKNSSSVRHLSWQAYHGLLRSKSQKTSIFLARLCLWLAATTEVNIGSLRLWAAHLGPLRIHQMTQWLSLLHAAEGTSSQRRKSLQVEVAVLLSICSVNPAKAQSQLLSP